MRNTEGSTSRRGLTVAGLNLWVSSIAVGLWLLVRFSHGTALYVEFLTMAVIIVLGLVAVLHGTVKKTKWGVNLDPVVCPRCGKPVAQVRAPKTVQQALWGGWTCSACGTELDKWGSEISPGANSREDGPNQGPLDPAAPVAAARRRKHF